MERLVIGKIFDQLLLEESEASQEIISKLKKRGFLTFASIIDDIKDVPCSANWGDYSDSGYSDHWR